MEDADARRDELIDQMSRDQAALTATLLHQRIDPLMDLTITFQQLKVLLLVASEPGPTTQGLAERLHVSAPTMSGVLDRLVEHGLVRRVEDVADRRVRRLVATAEGLQTAETVTSLGEWHRQQVLAQLDLADLEALAQGFRAVLRVAQRDDPTGVAPPHGGGTLDVCG